VNAGMITLLETKRIMPISCRPHQIPDEVWKMSDEIFVHPSSFRLHPSK
jgi:hypothetical protein